MFIALDATPSLDRSYWEIERKSQDDRTEKEE